ncbi:glutathione peroxidase [soil metagenome]
MRIAVLKPASRPARNLAFALTCVVSLALFVQLARAQSASPPTAAVPVAAGATPAAGACPAILNYTFPRLQDEKPQALCQYSGKVVLVVNTASFCGFTPQYKGLEALDSKYRSRGLVVLGFPSNDFSQESGSNKEIADFCESTFGVKFPMFSKSSVRGSEANPLFKQLAKISGTTPKWNFYKYLIGRDGKVVEAYSSMTSPDDRSFIQQVEKQLGSD